MWTQAMWDCILRWLRKVRIHHQPAHRPRYVLLHLEYLTERIVPTNTACTFLGTVNDDWGLAANWSVINNQNTMPDGSGTDTATIAPGVTCVQSTDANIAGLTVSANATLTVGADLTVQPNGSTIGNGTTSVAASGVLNIGSTDDASAVAKLDTNTFTDLGTTTVGGPSTGSSGTLDAVFATLGTTSGAGGILDIGAAGTGLSGDVTITNTLTVNSAASLAVGGAGNSGGSLDVQAMTSVASAPGTPNVTINPEGTLDIDNNATLAGDTLVTGLLDAKNIDAFSGASVILAGPGSVSGAKGQLGAGINANITFGPGSSWAIGPGNPVGSALKEGRFIVNGPLAFNTSFVNSDADITMNNDGNTTLGSIGGTGSIDWYNGEFDWNGGTISIAGGFTNENGDFKLSGSDDKFLSTLFTNTGAGNADFDGTGTLWLKTGGTLFNNATPILPMEVSLPLIAGFANGGSPGVLDNTGTIEINGSGSGVTISAPLDNEVSGVIDCATGAAPLTLSDGSGTSVLNGKIGLNNDSLTISGLYTTTSGAFEEEYSGSDLTTLTGTLTINSGASADFDHLVLTAAPGSGTGGSITGAGDFSIDADGGGSNDYLTWSSGTMTGTGTTTIGPNATMTLSGTGMMSRDVDNHGKIVWPVGGTVGFGSGVTVHNEKDGILDFESGGSVPSVTNDGLLEVAAGVLSMTGTFTQSSTGTLQSDIASGSSWGVLKVTGSATLDGTVQAQLEDGYQPPSGTAFDVLDFASSSGQFATVDPQGWSATYNPTDVELVSP